MIERLIEKQKLIWENRALLQKMVELNADYCGLAVKRLAQGVLPWEDALFDEAVTA